MTKPFRLARRTSIITNSIDRLELSSGLIAKAIIHIKPLTAKNWNEKIPLHLKDLSIHLSIRNGMRSMQIRTC